MAVYEGKWRCSSCGVLNQGANLQCPCGNPRGKDEEIFLEPDAPAVTDPALLAAASAGPNWFCGYCGAENVHTATGCKQCSGNRTQSSDGRKVQATEPRREVERSTGMRVRDEPTEAMAALDAPLLSLFSLRKCAAAGAVVVGFITLLVWLFVGTKEVEATVTETTWTRSVQVDQLGPREEGWDRPSDSELIQTEQRPRVQEVPVTVTRTRKATKEVPTGETKKVKTGRKIDTGNGFFKDEEKEVPVTKTVTYDEEYQETEFRTTVVPATWYVYRAWRKVRAEELSGERDPRWPTVVLLPEQRSGNRREEFSVVFLTAEGKTHKHNPSDEGEFQQFQKGSRRRLKVNNVGWLISVK
ncbi:conserved domain protein : Uncharacterized protein OS=Hyalangium minutum GN=DB31_2263 PE=4 SV=1 [Gemmata massiliana]|uniref:Conserved domain protein: Uncharacterized protein n=1 Tax=Gemmata massiliana TaxID=1210884 RepID=A0A6P2DKH9_9BACT|nr:hypothetical protein [Gemmata massiliana]VTS02873.1 conserved domain protein : Uncharacterized protein OS=Hyalangium minutum GN=DB31_2263 PE=4 SV=1 [Gemmata massiliana]